MHSSYFPNNFFIIGKHLSLCFNGHAIFVCSLKGNIAKIAFNRVATFGEKRDAVFSNSRDSLVVCDQCTRADTTTGVYSARTNSESKQPACCAAGTSRSDLAGARLLSRIESRGYKSGGQSITGCFSHPT